jgi:hypothetical protein
MRFTASLASSRLAAIRISGSLRRTLEAVAAAAIPSRPIEMRSALVRGYASHLLHSGRVVIHAIVSVKSRVPGLSPLVAALVSL